MPRGDRAARTTITVPNNLKKKMDGYGTSVNWSRVASDAFERRLLQLESQREAKTMDEVKERFRVADELDRTESYHSGREAGDRWARELARPRQLRPLKARQEKKPGIRHMLDYYLNGHNGGIARWLYETIHPSSHEISNVEVDHFWNELLGDRYLRLIEDEHFAWGFCEAALEIWDKADY